MSGKLNLEAYDELSEEAQLLSWYLWDSHSHTPMTIFTVAHTRSSKMGFNYTHQGPINASPLWLYD